MATSWSREAAFIGRVTAGTTHEIRNVLAIVRESAGLIHDLLRVSPEGAMPAGERLLAVAARIEAQTVRGAEHITRLNQFAHTLDRDRTRTDLCQVVSLVAFFSGRLARAKSQVVTVREAGPMPALRADPLQVQMAIFEAVEHALTRLPDGTSVVLAVGVAGPRAHVDVRGSLAGLDGGPVVPEDPTREDLQESLGALGAAVEPSPGGGGLRVVLPGEVEPTGGDRSASRPGAPAPEPDTRTR